MESICAQRGSPFTRDGHTRWCDSKTARVPGAGAGRCCRKPRPRCDLEAGRSVAVIPQEDVMVNQVGGSRVDVVFAVSSLRSIGSDFDL